MMKRIALMVGAGLVLPVAGIAQTTPIDALTRGQAVTLVGTVERIADEDEFLLSDPTGRVLVYIGPNAMPVRAGDQVQVEGRVDDDGPLEVYADAVVLPDGSRVTFEHTYE